MSSVPVSICIPCYNAAATIKGTIDSLLNQTFSDFELIICDNHSTDNTWDILQSIKDRRVKVFRNESNIGVVGNFQKVLSLACGKYVKCMCADDLITPDCIEKQLNAFVLHPDDNIVMVCAEKNVIGEDGRILFKKHFPGRGGIYSGTKAVRKSIRMGSNIFGEPGSVLFDREAAMRTTGFDIELELTYVVDFNFYGKLLKEGNLFVVKEPLFSFRVIRTSGTVGFKWRQAEIFNSFIDRHLYKKGYGITVVDRFIAKTMAWLMCIARNLVFKLSK